MGMAMGTQQRRAVGRRAHGAHLVVLAVLAVLAVLVPAPAGAGTTLGLAVTVVDPAGAPVPDVEVVATDEADAVWSVNGTTASDGTVQLDVPPGTAALWLQPTTGAKQPMGTASGVVDEIVPVELVAPTASGLALTPKVESIEVSWTAAVNPSWPAISGQRLLAEPGGIDVVLGPASTSYVLSGLTPDVPVTVRILPLHSGFAGVRSAPATVAPYGTDDLPGAPSGVTATITGSIATVTWTPGTVGPVPTTVQEVSVSDGRTLLTSPSSSSLQVPSLVSGTSYTFTVRGYSSLGAGPPSAPSAPVEAPFVPDPVTDVSVVVAGTTATVSWTPSADDGGSPVLFHRITVLPDGVEHLRSGSATSAVLTGLTSGATYTFAVEALNAVGTSALATSGPVDIPVLPSAPLGVSASVVGTTATVTWSPPADDGGTPVTAYTVAALPGGPVLQTGPSAVETLMPGLTPGATYTFSVRAQNAIGLGPAGSAGPLDVPTAPSAPRDVVAGVNGTSVALTWNPPLDDGGAPVAGYMVYVSPGGDPYLVPASATSRVVNGLTPLRSYEFTVVAFNSVGAGVPSEVVGPIAIPTVPGTPTTVTAVEQGAAALVTWEPSIDDGGSPVTFYEVEASPGGAIVTVGPSAANALVPGLTPGQTYTFRVRARNAVGDSPASTWSAPVTIGTVPEPPSAVVGDATGVDLVVTWTATDDDGGSPLTGYVVTLQPSGRSTVVFPGVTSAAFEDLPYGSVQTAEVMARNLVGDSAPAISAPVLVGWTDVPADHPFVDDIAWMAAEGFAGGFDDGTFQPGRSVTRQALAAFLYRMAGSPDGLDPTCTVQPFPDVFISNPFCGEITWAVEQGIITGYIWGGFAPDAKISRQAVAAMLWRAVGEPPPPLDAPTFNDVPVGHPFRDAIRWMAATGITEGYADGGFHPGDGVTRQAMAAFLHRYSDLGLTIG